MMAEETVWQVDATNKILGAVPRSQMVWAWRGACAAARFVSLLVDSLRRAVLGSEERKAVAPRDVHPVGELAATVVRAGAHDDERLLPRYRVRVC